MIGETAVIFSAAPPGSSANGDELRPLDAAAKLALPG
jgi:hypothetical protein